MLTRISHLPLIVFTTVLSISALYGGGMLLYDPSGGALQMPTDALQGTPFSSFLIPGLVLFVLQGLFPALAVYGLLFRPAGGRLLNLFNLYADRHWGWAYALYAGIMQWIWIQLQIMWVGYGHPIQSVYAFLGLAVVLSALLPPVMRRYELTKRG